MSFIEGIEHILYQDREVFVYSLTTLGYTAHREVVLRYPVKFLCVIREPVNSTACLRCRLKHLNKLIRWGLIEPTTTAITQVIPYRRETTGLIVARVEQRVVITTLTPVTVVCPATTTA